MLRTRVFLGGRVTAEAVEACVRVGIHEGILNESLVTDIQAAVPETSPLTPHEQVRVVYEALSTRPTIKSHLAVLFQFSLSMICKLIVDPLLGTRKVGRPRILTTQEEAEVVAYVKACQEAGHCVTYGEVTQWINDTMRLNKSKVSPKFLHSNSNIMDKLEVASPQVVEQLRVQASTYENFSAFFDSLQLAMTTHNFDPDLIINIDETTSAAEKSKKTTKVLFDPSLSIRPMATYGGKVEHVTLSCGISASGKHTLPCFIIKNKTITMESALSSEGFDLGPYGVQYSVNGWQDAVSIACKVVLSYIL
jgi:hypothetical protein